MKNPSISVITVCYNSEKTIRKTIESVIKQGYDNWHYYIIDGASTDRTVAVCEEYQKELQNKMTVISEPDDGLYFAMNKGIDIATGDVIALINSDDWYEDDAFEFIAKKAEEITEDEFIIYGMCNIFQKDKLLISGLLHPPVLDYQMMYHPAMFLSAKTYKKVGKFDTRYRIAADYDLTFRCRKAGIKFVPLYNVVSNYVDGGISDSKEAYYEVCDIRKKNGMISSIGYVLRRIKIWLKWIGKK